MYSVFVRRRRGKASATVHSTNLVVLKSDNNSLLRDLLGDQSDTEMGNKSSRGLSPTEKQKGTCTLSRVVGKLYDP